MYHLLNLGFALPVPSNPPTITTADTYSTGTYGRYNELRLSLLMLRLVLWCDKRNTSGATSWRHVMPVQPESRNVCYQDSCSSSSHSPRPKMDLVKTATAAISDPKYSKYLAPLLLLADAFLSVLILLKIPCNNPPSTPGPISQLQLHSIH